MLWPGMDKDVERECCICYGCQLAIQAYKRPEPMHRTQLPSAPWEHLATAFWGPLPSRDLLFVLVDYISRYNIVEIMISTTGAKTVRCLKNILSVYGFLLSITTGP